MAKIHFNRRKFLHLGALTVTTGVGLDLSNLVGMAESRGVDKRPKPNVLFIAADDLRCNLGCYGDTLVKSPNLDRLANRGVTFEWAYCQQALCNPSRASLLTGRRPDSLGIWNLETHFRQVIPDIVTFPQWFKQHGYFTQNIGKIFHNWRQDAYKGDPTSWSVPAVMHYGTHGSDKAVVDDPVPPNLAKDRTTVCRDVPDEAYFDGRIAAKSVKALRKLKTLGQPFFLAVGFWKPHSPFNAPKRYWDLYEGNQIPLPANPKPPKDVPAIALHNSREILGTKGRTLSNDAVREIRHGYLAAISYLDAQVGKVLDELDRLGLTDNTVVVFWADHGYHLGEKSLWAKTSNFELDARVPLIIAAPKLKTANRKTSALVELLDLYPTLSELCGLPKPVGVQGKSLVPVLKDPGAKVKDAAFTQHPRPAYYKGRPDVMGYSVRTTNYRYTEWRDWETGKTVARELYAHDKDPAETRNIVDMMEMKSVVAELSNLLTR